MTANQVMRDERTTSIENASYRWAYLFMSYALLASIMYRAFVAHESSWDLFAIVIAGGAVTTLYQGGKHVLSRRWALATLAAVAIAVALGASIVLLRR